MKLRSYIGGRWVEGTGSGQPLVDPTTGEELARASSEGLDFRGALKHARLVGGARLRGMTYGERALILGKIAETLQANRAAYGEIALKNSGNTEADAAIDIDGAIATLKYYARVGAALGDTRWLSDGGIIRLGKDEGFQALHIGVPLRGCAIHINAFNFPSWGLWEKASVALLAGVPVVAKPATSTAWLAQKMVEDVLAAGILPEGALSIIVGGVGDLLDHVTGEDVIAFTGSADTARRIRGHGAVLDRSVRVNVEADSLNACLLGPDVAAGSPEFDLLVREVVREMTQKAGQKCTAIRRIIAPAATVDALGEAITARLKTTTVGNPRNKDVRMGPLVSMAQRRAAEEGLAKLLPETRILFGGNEAFSPLDADPRRGAFFQPTLLRCEKAGSAQAVHEVEVFGPVATLIPYASEEEGLGLARRGGGSLVASVVSGDPAFQERAALELAPAHGRIYTLDSSVAKSATGHGIVMPMCVHGGPGRAGAGEELGGLRGLWFYHQRTAIQAPAARLEAMLARAARPSQ